MTTNKYLYHCTRLDNLDSILREGLKPQVPSAMDYGGGVNRKGVYLTTEAFGWMEWCTLQYKYKGAMLKIDVSGLELIDDSDLTVFCGDWEPDDRQTKDFICLETILPERIVEFSVEVEPNGYQTYNIKELNEWIKKEVEK